jgi:FtsP/CotA-like multicopper oxidase with cupredoxin domain
LLILITRYHSHFSIQYGNGVAGPIVINGPASANYDVDLGPLMVSDWYYGNAYNILARVNDPRNPYIPGFPGSPPPSDNVLFNGQNINPRGTGGSYRRITLTPGLKHRLRIINPSVENTFTLSLVGHTMQIIATDFVPVTPVNVTSLYVSVGQRYDVIITANQAVGNYWFNATLPIGPCGLSNNPRPAMIFSYTGASSGNPTNPGSAPPDPLCDDPNNFAPVVVKNAPVSSFNPGTGNTLNTNIQTSRNGVARVFWPVNNTPINITWGKPTLEYVRTQTTGSIPPSYNVISVPTANTVRAYE